MFEHVCSAAQNEVNKNNSPPSIVRCKRIISQTGKSKVSNVSILFRVVNIVSKEQLKVGFLCEAGIHGVGQGNCCFA